MTSLILSFIPLLLIFYYFFLLRSKMSDFAHNLVIKKSGKICYRCNEKNLSEGVKYNLYLCRPCEREVSVDNLISPISFYRHKFYKFLYTKKFEKLQSLLLYFTILLLFVNLVTSYFDYTFTSIPTNILLTIYWLLVIYRTRLVINGC